MDKKKPVDRKEEILIACLELAAEKGMGNVSMSQIADKVGIRKASLYNHFKSKDEIIKEMYEYIRSKAKETVNPTGTDYGDMVKHQPPDEIIKFIVGNYMKMNSEPKINMLYRVVYSERSFQPEAARIMKEEAERMMLATKQLFYAMQVHHVLDFDDIDMASISFTMAIHDIMEYDMDCRTAGGDKETGEKLINDYITWFCKHYASKERK